MLKNYLLPILIAGVCCAYGCGSAARRDALTLWYDAMGEPTPNLARSNS